MSRRNQKHNRQIAKAINHGACSKPAPTVKPPVPKQSKLSLDSRSLREEGKRLRKQVNKRKPERLNLVDGQMPIRESNRTRNLDVNTSLHYIKAKYEGHNHDHQSPINRKFSEVELTMQDFNKIKYPNKPRKSLNYRPIGLQESRIIDIPEMHTECS